MKKPVLVLLFCLGVCVLIILGASIGAGVQALRITAKPQSFISLAKLITGNRAAESRADDGSRYQADFKQFYASIIQTLESEELHRRTLDRVRSLHPNLPESTVEIKASQNRDSAIFNVRAFGTEPKYTRIFLDAALDEFMASRITNDIQQKETASVQVLDRASGAVEDLQDWAFPIGIGVVTGGLAGLVLSLLIAAFIRAATRSANPPALPAAE